MAKQLEYLIERMTLNGKNKSVNLRVKVRAKFNGILRSITLEGIVPLRTLVLMAAKQQKLVFNANLLKAAGVHGTGEDKWTVEEREVVNSLWDEVAGSTQSFLNPKPESTLIKLKAHASVLEELIESAVDTDQAGAYAELLAQTKAKIKSLLEERAKAKAAAAKAAKEKAEKEAEKEAAGA